MSSTDLINVPARGIALANFDDAMRFSAIVAKTDFAPKDFRGKPEACLLAIQHGAELGLSPMQALQSIAVVNGRPSVYGDTALAVCKSSPLCESVSETIQGDGEAMVAICVAKRRGHPTPVEQRYAVADAKRAGLWGKAGPWTQYPRRMLQMRARGFALRDAFPDVLRGLITAEEAQDYPTPEPAPRQVVDVRPQMEPRPHPRAIEAPAGVGSSLLSKAKLAINGAKTAEALEKCRVAAEAHGESGNLTGAEVAELLALIDGKLEWVSPQSSRSQLSYGAHQLSLAIAAATTADALNAVLDNMDLAKSEGTLSEDAHVDLLEKVRGRHAELAKGGAA